MNIIDDPTGWWKIWDDVWRLFGPPLALLVGGLVAVLLKRLSVKTEAVTQTAAAAEAAAAEAAKVVVGADEHLAKQDEKLDRIHNVVEHVLGDAAQVIAKKQSEHLDAQDKKLGEIHEEGRKTGILVNGQRLLLERQNAAYRAALTKAGVEVPEVSPDA